MKMELFDRQTVESLGARLDIQPKHVALFFPAGGTLAVQTDISIPTAIQAQIARVALEVLKVSNAVDITNKDQDLTSTGKLNRRRALEVERLKAVKALEGAERYANDLSALARVAEETLYQAPPLEATDAAGALVDREIRDYFRTLAGDALTEPLNDLQAGKLPRQLLALMRSPVPISELIDRVTEQSWEDFLQSQKAQQFQTVNNDRAIAAWAVGACAQLRTQLDKLAFFDPDAALISGRPVIRPASMAA
ncbi:MAG: hypothetical protein WBX11_12810 [Thiobacillaceae bacterium]